MLPLTLLIEETGHLSNMYFSERVSGESLKIPEPQGCGGEGCAGKIPRDRKGNIKNTFRNQVTNFVALKICPTVVTVVLLCIPSNPRPSPALLVST